MSQDNQILYDELKTPVVVFVAAVIVFIFGTVYVTNEIIQLFEAILGEGFGTFAKLMMYSANILNFAVMGIVLYGLYKAKGWARGAVAFVVAYFFVSFVFDLYFILVVGVKANVLKIAATTNLFCLVLSAYTLYSLFSQEVAYVIGKYKIENVALGAVIGVCLGLYGGVDEIETMKQLKQPDVLIISIVQNAILGNYCTPAAITSNCAKHPNYPTTVKGCKAFFAGSFEKCRQELSGTFASSITVDSVTAYMDRFAVCARTELFTRLQ